MAAVLLGGAFPAPSASPIPPHASGNAYVFAFPAGGPRLEVIPGIGGRISSLKLGAAELLFTDRGGLNWGATFWSSPQSVWSWPPPEALDRGPYTGGPAGSRLVLASPADPATGFAFGKRFAADDADTSFTLAFTLRNASGTAKQAAPWLVTRVPPGGLTFFPKGQGAGRGDLAPRLEEAGGCLWFDHGTGTLPGGFPKYYGDGAEGWMAHVDKDGLLLLEVFPDIPPSRAAPEEAEIEIYADPGRRYVEIEHQGPYTSLAGGDSLAWSTRWFVRRLPADVPRKAGDAKLLGYVTALVRRVASPAALRPHAGARASFPYHSVRAASFPAPVFPAPAGPVDAGGRSLP